MKAMKPIEFSLAVSNIWEYEIQDLEISSGTHQIATKTEKAGLDAHQHEILGILYPFSGRSNETDWNREDIIGYRSFTWFYSENLQFAFIISSFILFADF